MLFPGNTNLEGMSPGRKKSINIVLLIVLGAMIIWVCYLMIPAEKNGKMYTRTKEEINSFLVFNDSAQVVSANVVEYLGDSLAVAEVRGINFCVITGTKSGLVSLKRHITKFDCNRTEGLTAWKEVKGLGVVSKTVYFKEE